MDIVERLRRHDKFLNADAQTDIRDAAAEIERLRAELETAYDVARAIRRKVANG
jgi:hypothetical protein